jgi:uncharacterized protein YndB with AHSA1/START domain
MDFIKKEIKVSITAAEAFHKFVFGFNEWWPKEYTWSQHVLESIGIDARVNGLCSEHGPLGFRCDWGRITEIEENRYIRLKWQTGPNREPVPDPERASDITLKFNDRKTEATIIFEHFNFENYGEGAELYMKMMDSQQGWDYILGCFREYCKK